MSSFWSNLKESRSPVNPRKFIPRDQWKHNQKQPWIFENLSDYYRQFESLSSKRNNQRQKFMGVFFLLLSWYYGLQSYDTYLVSHIICDRSWPFQETLHLYLSGCQLYRLSIDSKYCFQNFLWSNIILLTRHFAITITDEITKGRNWSN